MKKEYISISKRELKQILELYTLDGFTQQEIGENVFRRKNLYGLTPNTVVQRVLHYMGINMQYRSDNKYIGVTSKIISQILDNRLIAYPIYISVEGNTETTFDFNKALQEALVSSDKYRRKAQLKDYFVIVSVAVLNYMFLERPNLLWIPVVVYATVLSILLFREPGETKGRFIGSVIFIILIVIYSIVCIMNNGF